MQQSLKQLDELGLVSRGKSKHRPRDAAHLYDGPYPFIQTGDVKSANFYITKYSQTYSEAGLKQSKLWKKGTLCITIAANIAETAILGIDACFPDSIIGFIADPNKACVKYIKYLMDTLKQRYQSVSQGAAQSNLSQKKLLSIKFPVPPLEKQIEISHILSSYDDLIENNRRRIHLLEQAARLIYEEWFIRFRFPGHEQTCFVDGLPEGWKSLPTNQIANINPQIKIDRSQNQVTFISMSCLSTNNMTINTAEFEKRDVFSGVKFQNGDVLFARITPCLENGKTGFVQTLRLGEVACGSTEFVVLRAKLTSPEFLYCLARSENFREAAVKSMTGSSGRQRVQPNFFANYKIPLPQQHLLSKFHDITEPSFKQIGILEYENSKLKEARDLLLPKLMNGEIQI